MNAPRIAPLDPPYQPDIADALAKWMPPGSSARAARDREIPIARTAALCGCEYEWGVHAAAYGEVVGLTVEALRATAAGASDDPVRTERDALLVRLADELHQTAHVSDQVWAALPAHWEAPQSIELPIIAGAYHAIAYVANGAQVALEEWGARFPASGASVQGG